MGVDIHFFVETERHGFWDLEAEFFLPRDVALISLISSHGIRGHDSANQSTAGFPEEVSRRVVGKWGTWDKEVAGYPPSWGNVEPFKDSYIGKVYPYFGIFGEGWMTTKQFANILKMHTDSGDYAQGQYHSALEYMQSIEAKGIPCRAVFFFDN